MFQHKTEHTKFAGIPMFLYVCANGGAQAVFFLLPKWPWNKANIQHAIIIPSFYSYFMRDLSGTVVSVQKGVFRTNCIDCLDRTNVVQSLLAHKSLQEQLQVCCCTRVYLCT